MRQLAGLAGVVGILAHGGNQFFHGRGGFFQRTGLLFGAADRSRLPAAISDEAVLMVSVPVRTW
jgi:hypothetical protein